MTCIVIDCGNDVHPADEHLCPDHLGPYARVLDRKMQRTRRAFADSGGDHMTDAIAYNLAAGAARGAPGISHRAHFAVAAAAMTIGVILTGMLLSRPHHGVREVLCAGAILISEAAAAVIARRSCARCR